MIDILLRDPADQCFADFAELAQYLAASPLTHVHVFPYSDRPGTDATAMQDKVHGSIVRERATRLREISRSLTDAFHCSQDGSVRPALTIDDGSTAVTDNYLKVNIGPGHSRNEWVQLHLRLEREQFHGEIIQ